jgi:nucleoside-diphosphate-sugar epimerase
MFTIFGATGLVGTALRVRLAGLGHKVFAPGRADRCNGMELGHVIFCIGDDRVDRAPFAVIDTHVSILADILQHCRFESFLYLSTVRVYMDGQDTRETATVTIDPLEPSQLYNLSKLTGEALCLAMKQHSVRVARVSNVTDVNPRSHLFLPTLIRHALEKGEINLYLAPESAKDYILLDDVVDLVMLISRGGSQRLYNVASGRNISAGEIVSAVQRHTGCKANWHKGQPRIAFTPIDIDRVRHEFGFRPRPVIDQIPSIIDKTRHALEYAA